jgi:tetratricopeptide (TPR) repeat protein
MKKAWSWAILCIVLGFSMNSFAQHAELKDGIKSYESGDYQKALQYFQIAINAEAQLKGNKAAEAYLYRARTHTALLQEAAKSGDEEAVKKNQDALILAYQDLESAEAKNTNDKFAKEIENEQTILYAGLLQGGASFLQTIYQDPSLSPETKSQLLDIAQRYLAAAKKLQPERYPAYSWYGQVMMLKRDNESALENFEESITKYKANPPEKIDLEYYNVYANLALLAMQKREAKKALELLTEGMSELKTAFEQAQKEENSDQEALKQKHQILKNDLQQLELDIYLHSPEFNSQAIIKFAQAVQEEPENYNLRMSYAKLLEERKDSKAAIEQYQKATEINNSDFIPYYNIGIIQLKQGAKLQQQLNEPSEAELQQLKNFYQEAFEALEKAHQLAPKDLPTLEGLVLVTGRLEMKEAYLKYRNLKKSL